MNRRDFLRSGLSTMLPLAAAGCGAPSTSPIEAMLASALLSTEFGLNIGAVDEALPWMAQAPTPLVRRSCYWSNMLDTRSHLQRDGVARTVSFEFQRQVDLALSRNLDLLVCFHDAPREDHFGEGFADFVSQVAASLPSSVTLQIGNEMNDPVGGWTPRLRGNTQFEWGRSYAKLYGATERAVRERGLTHRLVAGGLVGDPRAFLRGMHDAGVEPPIVAVHCYGDVSRAAFGRAREVRSVMPRARVWITELGSEGGAANDAKQVDDVRRTIDVLRGLPGLVDRAYWYRLHGDPAERQGGFGLIRPDGTARPAWREWRARAG